MNGQPSTLPSRKTLVALSLLAGGLLAGAVGCSQPPAPQARPVSPVRVTTVRRELVAPEVRLAGTVVARTNSEVASGAAGLVIEYPFREGAYVKQGDVLARLRSVTHSILWEAARATEREKLEHYKQLAAGYREEEQRQAKAAASAAQADYEYARAKLARGRDARRKGAITDDELDQSISAEQKARSIYAEMKAMFDLKAAGYRAEEIAEAKAAYAAQHQEVLRLEDEMKKRTITAPFDGFLVERHSDVGQWVQMGGVVATLVDLTEVDVVVNVEESLMHLVAYRQQVNVSFDALGGQTLTGVVEYIVPKSAWQGGSRSFPVKVRILNVFEEGSLPLLKEGMLGQVVLRGDQHEALLVHKDAIVRSSGYPIVFRVDAQNRVQPIPVTELLSYGNSMEITAALEPGDRLVTEGNERLRPAQEVRILSDAAPGGEASRSAGQPSRQPDNGTAQKATVAQPSNENAQQPREDPQKPS